MEEKVDKCVSVSCSDQPDEQNSSLRCLIQNALAVFSSKKIKGVDLQLLEYLPV